MRYVIDTETGEVIVEDGARTERYPLASAEGFALVSDAWLRAGWDAKHVYSFSWFGRPVIQLPEDMLRMQELIYEVKPDVLVETGIAHGGSLVFYASLFEAMHNGRVIGVDIEIRPHNRTAIEAHELVGRITMIEGGSTDAATVGSVKELISLDERVMVVLDSNHLRDHVLGELRAYADLVSVGSYLIVADGLMRDIVGAPRTDPEWSWNNPQAAIETFLDERSDFEVAEPEFPFNEGEVRDRVTYFKGGWLRRTR
jgi:cephalosporin hydroxylase